MENGGVAIALSPNAGNSGCLSVPLPSSVKKGMKM